MFADIVNEKANFLVIWNWAWPDRPMHRFDRLSNSLIPQNPLA
jgi:hypothetical protein